MIDAETMADIDFIAMFHADSSGLDCSWSAAIRVAVKKEADRCRAIVAKVAAMREKRKQEMSE
jgi:hypothetical protein